MTLRNRFMRYGVAGAALAACVAWASPPAFGEDIKKIMGENFQNVQRILVNLVTSNYASVPHDVGIIREHVDALAKSPPPSIKSQEEKLMFGVYASAVRNAADNLSQVTEEIIKRDPVPQQTTELRVDYLRVSAAQYYGIMVTGCVQCHNQFRRYMVKLK